MLLLKIFLIAAVAYFAGTLILVMCRIFASSGAHYFPVREIAREENEEDPNASVPMEARYRELIELGMIQLEPDEDVAAGCGRIGEIEEVLLVTNLRAFIMSRRAGATFYGKQVFYLNKLRPVPSSAGMLGNKMILSDGAKTGAMDSPGDKGFLQDAQSVVRDLNNLIRKAQDGDTFG